MVNLSPKLDIKQEQGYYYQIARVGSVFEVEVDSFLGEGLDVREKVDEN